MHIIKNPAEDWFGNEWNGTHVNTLHMVFVTLFNEAWEHQTSDMWHMKTILNVSQYSAIEKIKII